MITDRPQFFRVNRFTDLLDAPNTYIGQAGRLPRVNQGASHLEFQDPPVTGITSGWELIRTGTFTADTNITGLNGDADKLWMLIINTRHSTNFTVTVRFNNDFSTSTNWAAHRFGVISQVNSHDLNVSGTATHISMPLSFTSTTQHLNKIIIDTASGKIRTYMNEGYSGNGNMGGASIYGCLNSGGCWFNNVDNLVTINIVTGTITFGEFWLFRRRV